MLAHAQRSPSLLADREGATRMRGSRQGGPWRFRGTEKLRFQADGKRELVKNKQAREFVRCLFVCLFVLKVLCILQVMPASFRRGTRGVSLENSGAGSPRGAQAVLRPGLPPPPAAAGASVRGQRCPRGTGIGKFPLTFRGDQLAA